MKLPTNAAEWDKECERIVRAMQAYAAPYITPISKIISDDEGELLRTGSYVEMIGRRLLITNEHNVAILQTNSLATGCEFFIRTDWKSRLSE